MGIFYGWKCLFSQTYPTNHDLHQKKLMVNYWVEYYCKTTVKRLNVNGDKLSRTELQTNMPKVSMLYRGGDEKHWIVRTDGSCSLERPRGVTGEGTPVHSRRVSVNSRTVRPPKCLVFWVGDTRSRPRRPGNLQSELETLSSHEVPRSQNVFTSFYVVPILFYVSVWIVPEKV